MKRKSETRHKKKKAEKWKRYTSRKPPEWNVWRSMKIRCFNPRHRWFYMYGGRGITVCPHWLKYGQGFKNFLEDMGPRPGRDYDLSRRDHDGDYSPTNCIWQHRSFNRSDNGAGH